MREDKRIKDYVGIIHRELKEKHNIDIPEKKIKAILTVFMKRVKESIFNRRYVYINKYLYFYFNPMKEIDRHNKRIANWIRIKQQRAKQQQSQQQQQEQ